VSGGKGRGKRSLFSRLYGLNGTLFHTGTAIRTNIRIDFIDGIAFADRLDRAGINATPACDTGICDFMSHKSILLEIYFAIQQ
jgi:hypothetical protein